MSKVQKTPTGVKGILLRAEVGVAAPNAHTQAIAATVAAPRADRARGFLPIVMYQGAVAQTLIADGVPREEALAQAVYSAQKVWGSDARIKFVSTLLPSFGLAWAQCGFPLVETHVKLAASFMCTSVSEEVAAHMSLPWRCFALAVPSGLIRTGRAPDPCHLLVLRPEADPTRSLIVDMTTNLMLIDEPMHGLVDIDGKWTTELDGGDELLRRQRSIGRFVVGVCLELDDVERKQAADIRNGGGQVRRNAPEPGCWVFKLGRKVQVDVREVVQAFVRKGHKSPNVQTLARGHHKRQAYGPGGTLRKWVHVEPYWRGPETAPIAVRKHVVGDA